MSATAHKLFSASSTYREISEAEARKLRYVWLLKEQRGLFRCRDGKLWLVRSTSSNEFRLCYCQVASVCASLPGFPWVPVVELEPLPFTVAQPAHLLSYGDD